MKIKVQTCWNGSNGGMFQRLLVCGGLRVNHETWNRKTAIDALNLLAIEMPGVPRKSIRFIHV